MRYSEPPMTDADRYPYVGSNVSSVEGVLDRFSMDPIEGYPWNATPHAVSLAVIAEDGTEHRAPINRIIELRPVMEPATVEV